MRRLLAALVRRIEWLTILIPVVVGAAAALAYYSYRYANDLAQRGEQSIADTNRDLAEGMVKRIEQVVVESDRTLFELVDLQNLHEFPRRWSDIVRLSPAIESALILDSRYRIVPDGLVSKKPSAGDVEAFRRLFEAEILRDLELASLEEGQHKHLHGEYGGRYYLISYTRQRAAAQDYYIVLEGDLAFIVGEVFPEVFAGVDARRLYQVVDEHDQLVFGHPFTGVPEKYLISLPFSQTVYKWRLRMAPREAPSLIARESARRAFDIVLVVLSAATVFVGLAVLTLAVRMERRANQAKSDFIANVSHELKTPLSLIRMFGELLGSGRARSPEVAGEYAGIITRESERLGHLIDNVLDFARIERGKAAYRFEPGDLGEVVHRSVDLCRHRFEREGMRVTVLAADHLPRVDLDEDAMTLLLLNLLDNAVKYAASGKDLAVSLREDRDRLVIEVRDHGPGIPREEHERIFERFYRARAVRGQPVRGSGIGLSLVRHVAEAHGGGVEVDSEVGKGATFTVWLPVRRPRSGQPDPDVESAA